MRKQLVLHIGRPKVGSTALQIFLRDNRDALLQNGVLYPQSALFNGGSHKLALVFQPELPDFRAVRNTTAKEIYDAMFAEADEWNTQIIVASSENFFLIDPALPAAQLRRRTDTRIVCYVRRQDEVLVSSLLQELKEGSVEPGLSPEEYARAPERLRWLDYGPVLDRWANAFGKENITVRVMEGGVRRGYIEEDFLSVLGMTISGFKPPAAQHNISPARDVLQFIQMINDAPSMTSPRIKQAIHKSLLEASTQLEKAECYDARALVPPHIRRELMNRFRLSNSDVARRYLGRKDGVLFEDEPITDSGEPQTYEGLDLERFARMMAALLTDQQRQIFRLQVQLNALREKLQH